MQAKIQYPRVYRAVMESRLLYRLRGYSGQFKYPFGGQSLLA